MVTFVDGPAKFRKLNLHRLPVYLRVVFDTDGTVDALDMPDDKPKVSEGICVYKMIEDTHISTFMCGSTVQKGCVHFHSAAYKMCEVQPEEKILKDINLWGEWVEQFHEGKGSHAHT